MLSGNGTILFTERFWELKAFNNNENYHHGDLWESIRVQYMISPFKAHSQKQNSLNFWEKLMKNSIRNYLNFFENSNVILAKKKNYCINRIQSEHFIYRVVVRHSCNRPLPTFLPSVSLQVQLSSGYWFRRRVGRDRPKHLNASRSSPNTVNVSCP